MKKFLIAVLVLLSVMFLITRFTEMREIGKILQAGDWRFIFLGGLLELLWLLNVNLGYFKIYQALEIPETKKRLFLITNAATFVNTMTPSGGFSGLAIFLNEAKKNDHPTGKVTVACIIYLILDYVGLLFVAFLSLIVLFRRDHIQWMEIVAFVLLFLLVGVLAAALFLATKSPDKFSKVTNYIVLKSNNLSNKIIHKQVFSPIKAAEFVTEIIGGISVMRTNPAMLKSPLLLTFSGKIILILVLLMVFYAFNVPVSAGTIIAGFGLCSLFVIISPTPSGIGIVEGVLTLALKSLGLTLEAATIVTLGYRALTFWLPLLIGVISFQILNRVDKKPLSKIQPGSKTFSSD